MLVKLAHALLIDFLANLAGLDKRGILKHAPVILPVATGMSLTLGFLALAKKNRTAKHIIFSRIDQKSCIKSIIAAGFEPVVVEQVATPAGLVTDCAGIQAEIARLGRDSVLCVLATTACFAPRQPDDVVSLAKICKTVDLPLVVNNAYGLQCPEISRALNRAHNLHPVALIVQSLDKNFLVPVGGAVALGPVAQEISALYPGRASSQGPVDLFITFLEVGRANFARLLAERTQLFQWFKTQFTALAEKFGLSLIESPSNSISLALDFSRAIEAGAVSEKAVLAVGAELFHRRISGPRVVCSDGKTKSIDGVEIRNFGSHQNAAASRAYLTAAVAVGVTQAELELFLARLEKSITKMFSR